MHKRAFLVAILAISLFGCASQPATEITVELADFTYAPSSITIPVGQPVVLTINNTGLVEHDFVVEEIDVTDVVVQDESTGVHHMHGNAPTYDLHVSTGAGQTNVLQFTALEPGTYKVFCSVEGHIEAGMLGELIVAE
jgi:uncharacterized cupredoxin-like copper-binding protein